MSLPDEAVPFFHQGDGMAILGLHGFSGTPFELKLLGNSFALAGYSVYLPLLPGHGRTVADLARTSWQEWLSAAEAAFDHLRKVTKNERIVLLGSSMGGLLALLLAHRNLGKVSSLILFSPPIRLALWQSLLVKAWSHLPPLLRRGPLFAIPKRDGCDVTDEIMRRRNPTLTAMPIAGIAQLLDLGRQVRKVLGQIQVPTLIVHGLLDHTVPPKHSRELASKLRTCTVEQCWLAHSGHLVGLDVERKQLASIVCSFLEKWA